MKTFRLNIGQKEQLEHTPDWNDNFKKIIEQE